MSQLEASPSFMRHRFFWFIKSSFRFYTTERQIIYKEILHQRAYQKGEDYHFELPEDERKVAEQEIIRRFGEIDTNMRTTNFNMGFPACFTGEGLVLMANGSFKFSL